MLEDELTHDERVRLEAVIQAVALSYLRPTLTVVDVVNTAQHFEKFIKGENENASSS